MLHGIKLMQHLTELAQYRDAIHYLFFFVILEKRQTPFLFASE